MDFSNLIYLYTQRRLSPEQRLYIATIIMVIQDLNLEKNFKELRQWFIIAKNKRFKRDNIISALDFLHSKDYNYCLSFVNCCEQLNLNPNTVRTKIVRRFRYCDPQVKEVIKEWKHEKRHQQVKG